MSNMVIAGDYEGSRISSTFGAVYIQSGFTSQYSLDKNNVEAYEVITEERRKSAASGAARGLVGGFLLGPVGMLAGGLSAKNKGTYQIAIKWKTAGKSLIEVDEKIYKSLVKSLF